MKIIVAAAAASVALQPIAAAELPRAAPAGRIDRGAFAGARLRVPLGASREKAHAGLALTSFQRVAGEPELRFAKGLELGYAGDETLRLSLHGQPVSRLAPGARGQEGQKLGVSTLGWIGIGVGIVAVGLVGFGLWLDHEIDQCKNC